MTTFESDLGENSIALNCDKGVRNGLNELYSHNGKISEKGNYKNGEKDGEWRYYDIYGYEKSFVIYKDDKETHSESIIRN